MKSAKKKIFTSVLTAMMLMVTLIPSMAFADDSSTLEDYDTAACNQLFGRVGQGGEPSGSAYASIYFFHGSEAETAYERPQQSNGSYTYLNANTYGYKYTIKTDTSVTTKYMNYIQEELDADKDIAFGIDIVAKGMKNFLMKPGLDGTSGTYYPNEGGLEGDGGILDKITVQDKDGNVVCTGKTIKDAKKTKDISDTLTFGKDVGTISAKGDYYIIYDMYAAGVSGNSLMGEARNMDLTFKIPANTLKKGEGYSIVFAAGIGGDVNKTTKDVVFNFETKPVVAEGIQLDKTEAELTVGDKLTLAATVSPEDTKDKSVKWTSSDETVAVVGEDTGEVEALSEGTVTIKATAVSNENVSAECTVTVVAAADDSVAADGENADEDLTAAGVDDEENADAAAKTGDYMSIAIPVCLILAAMAAAAAVIYRRKTADK